MCDVCVDFHELLLSYDERSFKDEEKNVDLCSKDIETILNYVNQWAQRQCMCCYRDIKNFNRFVRLIHNVVICALRQLQEIQEENCNEFSSLKKATSTESEVSASKDEKKSPFSNLSSDTRKTYWSSQDREKLFQLLSKIFLLNFPLYIAMKHGGSLKMLGPFKDEGGYCEIHDSEVPIPLLHAVSMFCHQSGFKLMTGCFDVNNVMPISLAHSMVVVICNLKLWLSYDSVIQLFIPLRSKIVQYMCNLTDKELRTSAVRTMSDFMWSAVKDAIDAPLPTFDRDGLDLAFKYFTSTTLTMRLAGISQINSHITAFNELCHNESRSETEQIGCALSKWLIDNNIIAHIFGPNLHVEVIKQCHIILSFLAIEGNISSTDIETIWQASQLKHCARPVYDLLAALVKHLTPSPVLQLYSLLKKLEPKEHTEQSLFLVSSIIKYIWSSVDSTCTSAFNVNSVESLRYLLTEEGCSSSESSEFDGPDSDNEDESGQVSFYAQKQAEREIQILNKSGTILPIKIEQMINKSPKISVQQYTKKNQENSKYLEKRQHDKKCSCSEAEADTEKSNPEDVTIHRKKRKLFRKRKPKNKDQSHKSNNTKDGRNFKKAKIVPKSNKTICSDEASLQNSSTERISLKDVRKVKVSKKVIDTPDKVQEVPPNNQPKDQALTSSCSILDEVEKSGKYVVLAHELFNTSHEEAEDVGDSFTNLTDGKTPDTSAAETTFLEHSGNSKFISSSLDETLSEEEGSYSTRVSNKSEKDMADFDGEESGCEEELAKLAARHLTSMHMRTYNPQRPHLSPVDKSFCKTLKILDEKSISANISTEFHLETVCKPGSTLLWDLLQDDKIGQLSEGLANEAEKALCNLLCCNMYRSIPMKFIEGCLENLAHNRSVVISLRILPKLLISFQQFGIGETHAITMWADRERGMLRHFFNNLQVFCNEGPKSLYSYQMEVQVRLQFLSSIFSPLGSPDFFRLNLQQIDILWHCLVQDTDYADEFFNWLFNQAKSTEHHALDLDTLKHLCMRKIPSLPPEKISLTGLNLFQQLCNLTRLTAVHLKRTLKDIDLVGMDFLWKIALKAKCTEVSMIAIQYLNSYYISRQLTHEIEFVSQCMMYLSAASADLKTNEEGSLKCIQRALLLLRTHLETFKKRYAYHLRRWTLEGLEGTSYLTMNYPDKCQQIRIFVQPAGISEKTSFNLLNTDYIADLRAEVSKWWDDKYANCDNKSSTSAVNSNIMSESMFDSFSTYGAIRMITQGQELTVDYDEKTLQDVGFKDGQLVFISPSAARSNGGNSGRKKDINPPSSLPPPPKEFLPTLLLLKPPYFEQLFTLMKTLSTMKTTSACGAEVPNARAQVLSRRVWDTLTLLPTSPMLLEGFQKLDDTCLSELLNPSNPQKLMYSLYIVESLSKRSNRQNITYTLPETSKDVSNENSDSYADKFAKWSDEFIQYGGLAHLFNIFMSGYLESEDGTEWQQDCLTSLLKQLYNLGICNNKKLKKNDKLHIPKLSKELLSMMKLETVLPRIVSILKKASLTNNSNNYKTGLFGRSQVIHYAMALLVSWVHSDYTIGQSLFSSEKPLEKTWLRTLLLDDPDASVRREVCTALHKLCLGSTEKKSDVANSESVNAPITLISPLLTELLEHLPVAEASHPQQYESFCHDYFWLLCRLIDSLPENALKETTSTNSNDVINLDALATKVVESIVARDYIETRHNTLEDDGLIGLLNLCCSIMAHNPPCKQSKLGQNLLLIIFDFLFSLPSPEFKHMPKCKSLSSRAAAFDLLVELVKSAPENYTILFKKLLTHHEPGFHTPYGWDYWPHDDGRSDCGYVGLTNLGATCYMASCMQHLYMMPEARTAILNADCNQASKHLMTLKELQKMFAYLLESERKAYNPKSFCRLYTMNNEPLNTSEQKDMAEFFIDVVSKLEEMTDDLKNMVKDLFCGIISNNVVSLDCQHVSRTLEEFYTVRCQVADMRNLYESLDEVTVKDTLEGDNMYTCSQCSKKVRAEKRACFKKLPRILCFNTMRYTFNMETMLKEKVNTHFSFPMRLDMSGYMENVLLSRHCHEVSNKADDNDGVKNYSTDDKQCYDLIGVTVHTGTADGGHYYSFIKDRSKNKWFLFNDAEIKPFDPNQIAAECFGGEMTSKTYDSVTDKFMDFSFEKSNSAYMLFYELCKSPLDSLNEGEESCGSHSSCAIQRNNVDKTVKCIQLNKELEDWIWQDNMQFLQDKNIFEHTYFNFMWQISGVIPQTLLSKQPEIVEISIELATSFFLETFIHAKEKPTMIQWVELLTKQFSNSVNACFKFLEKMTNDSWWPIQILVKCPNQMVRQVFQRLCLHVIQILRNFKTPHYSEFKEDFNANGKDTCITRFVTMILSLLEYAKQYVKHLAEYFGFLYEFCKMGDEEMKFLIKIEAISTMINFYLGYKIYDVADPVSEEDEEGECATLLSEKLRPTSLEKMITLVAVLVEKSRGPDNRLSLTNQDFSSVSGGKSFPFLFHQIRDMINLNQTKSLIQSLCCWNDRLALQIVTMIFQAIAKHIDFCQPFFKILTLLTESTGPRGLPCMTQLILNHIWEVARIAPHGALEWLAVAVTRNKLAHAWVLQSLDTWVEHFLLEHANQRVRSAAAVLLVSLIPSLHFRQAYRNTHRLGYNFSSKDLQLSSEAINILHQIYASLLRLLQPARLYTDIPTHGTMKLTAYFALMTHCVVSNAEKLMFGPFLNDLWTLFHPKLSEPSIPVHHNKQALLLFWYHVSSECPENITLILQNSHITKNIAYNYILADHEDQEVVLFNRVMLPAYYGLLRLCCQQSRAFTRQLAMHQNIQWAFKNITPYPTQYSAAVGELFKLMEVLVTRHPDISEQESVEIANFRRGTLTSYLQGLDGRSCWVTLISAFRILIESDDDRQYVICNGGINIVLEAFHTLHIMYHEATACHVTNDLIELIAIIIEFIHCLRISGSMTEARNILTNGKEWPDVLGKLATLLNTYNPPSIRNSAIDLLREFVMLVPNDVILTLAPMLSHCHIAVQESLPSIPFGPYLPRRTSKSGKTLSRPNRPMVQMAVPHSQLEAAKGVDADYDSALIQFYLPYHKLIDLMCRLAIDNDCMTDTLVNLSAILGFEGVPLHLALFPRLWMDVYTDNHIDKKHISALIRCPYTVDYIDAVLLDERSSLNVPIIHTFIKTFFPKLANHVLTEQTCSIICSLVDRLISMLELVDIQSSVKRLVGDLRALTLVYSNSQIKPPETLEKVLELLLARIKSLNDIDVNDKSTNEDAEIPRKKRKLNSSDSNSEIVNVDAESENENINVQVDDVGSPTGSKENFEKSCEENDEKNQPDHEQKSDEAEATCEADNKSSSIASSSTSNSNVQHKRTSVTNVSSLDMLEMTTSKLLTIVQQYYSKE